MLFRRPLIPVLFSFTAGILAAHEVLSSSQWIIFPAFFLIALFLLALPFMPRQYRITCLLILFFLTGIVLDLVEHRPSQLLPLAEKRKKITVEGTVLEPMTVIQEMARLKVRAHVLFSGEKAAQVNENLRVSVYNHPPYIRPGDKIRFPARLRPFRNFNNPGRYDYESAMKLRGYSCAASVSDGRGIVPMGPGYLPYPRGVLERIQRPVRDFLKEKLAPQDCALFRALLLGERQGISPELRDPFNKTGVGHILAVSGLHVGLVAWVAFLLIRGALSRFYALALKVDIRKLAALLTCVPVVGYTCLAGFHVSSQRAMIMVIAFLWSLILGREKEVWSTLALAGLLILGLDPHALFSISFQLSFSAVIGILWLTPPILNSLPLSKEIQGGKRSIVNSVAAYFVGLVAVSLSATVFLLPVISYYFHRISLVTIPANITVVPLLGFWVIPMGLLSALALPLSSQVAGYLLHSAAWGLHGMMEMIHFWASLPWSSFWVITPNLFEILLFYLLIFFIFFFKGRPWARLGVSVITVLILADIAYWTHRVHFNRDMKVTFLDVGQANSALVEFPGGKKMLIDGGGFPRDYFDVGKMVVAPFLWHSKILHIDYLVLSHPQADHMNGLRFIARYFDPDEFWYNGDQVKTASFRQLMAIIESKGIKKLLPPDLQKARAINGARVEVLHPEANSSQSSFSLRGTGLNNNSLVLKISFAGMTFLFPGDLEKEGEAALVSNNRGGLLKSDVLLSPHHGSGSSSTRGFLKEVRPRICIISSGEGNYFGFPHEQTLQSLKEIGCRTLRIDQSGAVQCSVGPDLFKIETFLQKNCNSPAF